jgi:hypothetical protein
MQKATEEPRSSHDLQIKALCDALDRASRAARNSEAVARQAKGDLQGERRRYLHASAQLRQLEADLQLATEENLRLREAVGELNRERKTLTERIKELTAGTPAPALRVVKEPETARASHWLPVVDSTEAAMDAEAAAESIQICAEPRFGKRR